MDGALRLPTGVTPTYYAGAAPLPIPSRSRPRSHRAGRARRGASSTAKVQRASQMARPSSSVRAMPPDLDGPAHPDRGGLGGEVAVAHGAQVAGVELDPDHAAVGPGGQRGPEAGGRLGQEGRDAAVEDPVGLVHLPVHREAQDDPFGAGLEDLDVEQVVDARAGPLGECGGVAAGRGAGEWSPPDVNGAPLA